MNSKKLALDELYKRVKELPAITKDEQDLKYEALFIIKNLYKTLVDTEDS